MAFHPEVLTFRNGIFSTLRPTLWKLFSGAARLKRAGKDGRRSYYPPERTLAYHRLCTVENHADWVALGMRDHAHFLLASLQFDQIELDVDRTEETMSAPEAMALRRILRAFCLRNPEVGYCQAMNFVAISLLRATRTGSLSEADAFWMLVAVCEHIVPFYYVKDMSGVQEATKMLGQLVDLRMPRLARHLVSVHFPLELCTVPWLCSLFSNSFPAETVYRIWDALFLNGADTLFFVALAFLKTHREALLAARDMMECDRILKEGAETCYNSEALMDLALEERNGCVDRMEAIRTEDKTSNVGGHPANWSKQTLSPETMLRTMAAKKGMVDLVRNTPSVDRMAIEDLLGELLLEPKEAILAEERRLDEIEVQKSLDVLAQIRAGTTGGGDPNGSNKPGKSRPKPELGKLCSAVEFGRRDFITRCVRGITRGISKEDPRRKLWKNTAFDAFSRVAAGSSSSSTSAEDGDQRTVNLQRFVAVLALFHRGSPMVERLRLCFYCFDVEHTDYLSVNDLRSVFFCAYSFFCPEISDVDLQGLAARAVRRFNLPRTRKINQEEFARHVLATPILCDLVKDVDGPAELRKCEEEIARQMEVRRAALAEQKPVTAPRPARKVMGSKPVGANDENVVNANMLQRR